MGVSHRRRVAKRRSPLLPDSLRPSLSLPLPAAIYKAKAVSAKQCSGIVVVAMQLTPYILSCLESGTTDFFLRNVGQPEAFDVWGHKIDVSAVVKWQIVLLELQPSAS